MQPPQKAVALGRNGVSGTPLVGHLVGGQGHGSNEQGGTHSPVTPST